MFRHLWKERKKTTPRPIKYEDRVAGSTEILTNRLLKRRRWSEESSLLVLGIGRAPQGPGAARGGRAWPGSQGLFHHPAPPWSRAGQGRPAAAPAADIRYLSGNGDCPDKKEDC